MKEEKKTIDTELKEARERLQYLLAVSPAIIYTTKVSGDYGCTFVSENLHEIVGYTPQEMTTDPKFWGTRLHPEDAPRVLDDVFPLIDKGGGTLEYRFQHREGHYLWFQDTFKVIHDEAGRPLEIVGSWADITERKRAEEALRESEEHYRAVIENVADAIVINVGTNRVFVNKAFLKLHGLDDVSQVLGTPLDQFIVPEDRQLVSERTLARQRGQPVPGVYEYRIRRVDGEVRTVQTSAVSITYEGQPAVLAVLRDTTERKRAEEALKAAKDYDENLINSSLDAIVSTDVNRDIVEFNHAAEDAFGYSKAEVVGRSIEILYADPSENLKVGTHMRDHGRFAGEIRSRRKNGEIFDAYLSASVIRDPNGRVMGAVGVSRDITERKRAEEALRQAEEKYRSIFENAVEGIFQTTPDGRYRSANPALARIYGYESPEELIQNLTDIAPQLYVEPTRRAEFIRLMQEHGAVSGFESQVYRKDGNVIWISESARAVRDKNGVLLYYEGTIEDITERKRAEEALQRAHDELERRVEERTAELQQAKEVAEAANQAKSLFLANMGHELRTPLNHIIGYSEMLQEQAEEESQKDFIPDLQKIRGSGKHLLGLINDILELSKIEAGKMDLSQETFTIAPMIQDIVTTIKPLVDKNANTLEVHCADDLGTMRADLTKVRQALFNLLSNACKFTERGTITLGANREMVDGTAWIKFRVSDTGIGMTPEQMGKLFQAFHQADASATRNYGGTGLGLAISQRICQMTGGEITVESALGQGSTFTISLPAMDVRG